jgi:hypothetical protein
MEGQDGGQDAKQVARLTGKLQLPLSCDPPGPDNPPKQLVWIVSRENFFDSDILYHKLSLCIWIAFLWPHVHLDS